MADETTKTPEDDMALEGFTYQGDLSKIINGDIDKFMKKLAEGAVDKSGREINPDAYITSLNDARYIDRANNIFLSIWHSFLGLEDEKFNDPATQAYIRATVVEAFAKNRITKKRVTEIANRVFYAGRYWSYDIESTVFSSVDPSFSVVDTYKVDSNTEGIDGIIFSDRDCPAFFETEDIAESAAALNIPEDIKYIPSSELYALRRVYRVYGEYLEGIKKPQASEPGFITVPSNPVIDVFANLGRSAYEQRTLIENFDKTLFNIPVTGGVTIGVATNNYDLLVSKNIDIDKLHIQFLNTSFMSGYSSKTVTLSLDEIMTFQGKADRKEAAEAVRAALLGLYAVEITYSNTITGDLSRRKIVQSIDYLSGRGHKAYAKITYTDDYFNSIKKNKSNADYSDKLMKLNGRRGAYAYKIGRAFYLNKRMNVAKKNENTLSVATLLDKSGISSFQSLKNKAQASQRIIKPFVSALDYLEEQGILSYTFQLPGGGDIQQQDLENIYVDYNFFITLMVKANFYDEPNYSYLREHREAVNEGRKRLSVKKAVNAPAKKRGRPRKTQHQEE